MSNTFQYGEAEYKINTYMALLRNLKNIAIYTDKPHIEKCLAALKAGVLESKQFPFRFYSAYKRIQAEKDNSEIKMVPQILDTLQECMDIAVENMPKLKGRTMALSDNSGSAWGNIPTEYGSVKTAVIDNLSSVLAAKCSDEGYVGKFGDSLKTYPVGKREGILSLTEKISEGEGYDVGMSTEGGIWEFFDRAIQNKEHWDNILIYSDCQAGTGGLYGKDRQRELYSKLGFSVKGMYINVFKLVQEYRKKVNPKVNVASIQTAGYDNVLLPEMSYRTALLTGWTGKEIQFFKEYIDQWDQIENTKENK